MDNFDLHTSYRPAPLTLPLIALVHLIRSDGIISFLYSPIAEISRTPASPSTPFSSPKFILLWSGDDEGI